MNFQNVTDISGISFAGFDYGAAWGDYNNDGQPDLWTGNHFDPGALYRNNGNGTFTNVTADVFEQPPGGDKHGAAWADFDNDGDLDLIQLVGAEEGLGSDANRFYVNEGGRFVDRASELGVDNPLSRGRMPLWVDYDRDGNLDLVASAIARPDGQAPSTIFRSNGNSFTEDVDSTGFARVSSQFSVTSDLTGDGISELIVDRNSSLNPITIYDVSSTPFEDITNNLLPINVGSFQDVAIADFNGDLRNDLYFTRYGLSGASALQEDDNNGLGVTLEVNGEEQGAQFQSSGDVSFDLGRFRDTSKIFIGSTGINPDSNDFTLSPSDPNVVGTLDHTPGVDEGVYISYDPNLQSWQILFSSPNRQELAAAIQTGNLVPDSLTPIGFNPDVSPQNDRLLINTGDGFIDRSDVAGINNLEIAGQDVAAADFDNDMDVDLYLVTTGPAGNQPNILLENQGDGTFVPSPNANGAEGTLLGSAGSVATADYDTDGFVDLFLLNGTEFPPPQFRDGPYQLFRNEGNGNHWLEIDLEGVSSNRDGIGATVLVTAGGVTQIREQNGGVHHQTQNHQRLHFGLANNTTIDEIEVRWPTGESQTLQNIPADQVISIVESQESFNPSLEPPVSEPSNPSPETPTLESQEGVFISQNAADNSYNLRVAGSGNENRYQVNLVSTDRLSEVTPVFLEPNDRLETNEFGFTLNSEIIQFEDGVNFQLAPEATALISVTENGNPGQLSIQDSDSSLDPIAPTGWIVDTNQLPQRPSFTPIEDSGLFVGRQDNSSELEFRWTNDGTFQQRDLTVIPSSDTATFEPSDIDTGGAGVDVFTPLENGIAINSNVGNGTDGLNVNLGESNQIGFSFKENGSFQPQNIKPFGESLGSPNAYELPLIDAIS